MSRGGVTGDFKKLLDFAKRVGGLAGQPALTAVSSALADATIELIDEGFEAERDPAGKPWESKVFPDGRPVLEGRSKKLRRSFRKRQVTSRGFEVESTDPKFRFHQGGTGVFGPRKRRIFPKKKRFLSWPIAGGRAFAASVEGAPQRKMLPDKGKGMPTAWRRRLIPRAKTVLRELLAKR